MISIALWNFFRRKIIKRWLIYQTCLTLSLFLDNHLCDSIIFSYLSLIVSIIFIWFFIFFKFINNFSNLIILHDSLIHLTFCRLFHFIFILFPLFRMHIIFTLISKILFIILECLCHKLFGKRIKYDSIFELLLLDIFVFFY